jgi:hypothetical protein
LITLVASHWFPVLSAAAQGICIHQRKDNPFACEPPWALGRSTLGQVRRARRNGHHCARLGFHKSTPEAGL